MNICLLGQYPPHLGGVSSHTQLLSKELVERGDHVHVLTYPHPDIQQIKDITVETAPTVNIKGLRGFLFSVSSFMKLISLVRKYQIDVIHAHFLIPPGLIAVLVGKLTNIKVAVTVHGSDILLLAKNPILRSLIKYVLSGAEYIAVVDEAIRKKVLELEIEGIEDKIMVTPNAVDLNKFNPQNTSEFIREAGLDPHKNIILFVGNLVPQKGLKYLLKAKEQLKSPAELVIIGEGPLMAELQETVRKNDIKDVHFTGARRDVDQIMPAADLLVLPSKSEGFPITILEALACGLPVVATKVGGIKELVTPDIGILVEPENPQALTEAIDKMLQNNELRDKMSEAAPLKAGKYGHLKVPY